MSANVLCPAVVVQRWRTLSALLAAFSFLRKDPASRLALRRGELLPLPPMSPAARAAGAFGLILPTRKGFMWLLSSAPWLDASADGAAGKVATLTAPGGEMDGREMVVIPLSSADMLTMVGQLAGIVAEQGVA